MTDRITAVTSTPVNPSSSLGPLPILPVLLPREDDSGPRDSLLAGARNIPRTVKYSSDFCYENIRPSLPARWADEPITCLKYVNDCLAIEKVPFKNGLKMTVNGRHLSVAKAVKSNIHYNTVLLSLIHI